jgi:hypothetical protein
MFGCSKLQVAAAALAVATFSADMAFARCTRLAFSVNDYGKDGPTKDAKQLLDKYIAEWTAQRGIKTYTVGKKDVTCELFLDFVVFDEHTCKAAATVCWPGNDLPQPVQAKAAPAVGDAPKKTEPKATVAPKKATAKAAEPVAPTTAPTTTGSIPAVAPAAAVPVSAAVPAAAPAATEAPAAPPAKTQ